MTALRYPRRISARVSSTSSSMTCIGRRLLGAHLAPDAEAEQAGDYEQANRRLGDRMERQRSVERIHRTRISIALFCEGYRIDDHLQLIDGARDELSAQQRTIPNRTC